jgi:cytochrome c5
MKLKVHFKLNYSMPRPASALLLIFAAAFAACVSARALPVAGPADVKVGASRFPDITPAELADGRRLFANRCGSCHRPPAPESQTPDDWPGHIHEMKQRAHLDDAEARLVERYVVTMALPRAR